MAPANRTIWTFWDQGVDAAGPLVRLCVDSWRRQNPDWTVVALDRRSLLGQTDLGDQIALERPDLTVQKLSVLARLALLRSNGGVWADATLFCRRPLDDWLPALAPEGFFTFRDPGPDRLISNWFIAADPDDEILVEFHRAFLSLWRDNFYRNQSTPLGRRARRALRPLLTRNTRISGLWLSWPVRRLLGVYPYFQSHYAFNRLIRRDASLRARWRAAPAADAKPVRRLQHFARIDDVESALAEIERGTTPVFKLNWRVDATSPYWQRVLAALEATLPPAGQPT